MIILIFSELNTSEWLQNILKEIALSVG